MIAKDKYELVKKAIRVHNRLKDRTYLILYKVNARQSAKYMETPVLEENFWHLVGCKIDASIGLTPKQKHQIYSDCVNGIDISNYLVYTRQAQDVAKKANVVINSLILLQMLNPFGYVIQMEHLKQRCFL